MNTLVIHPKDKTTDMLELVYCNHPEYTVCRDDGISKMELERLIDSHERIIMLGHGTPLGLINSARNDYLINDSMSHLFKNKDTYSVWCFSKDYFKKHNLHGFHTGMIISEVQEELLMLKSIPLNEKEMLANFKSLSKYLGDCIEYSPEDMKKYMLENYVGTDPVTQFNRSNIWVI